MIHALPKPITHKEEMARENIRRKAERYSGQAKFRIPKMTEYVREFLYYALLSDCPAVHWKTRANALQLAKEMIAKMRQIPQPTLLLIEDLYIRAKLDVNN